MTAPSLVRNVALVLSGGGNRAFYQLGLLNRWWPRLAPRIGAVAACSAGACVAAMFLADRRQAARAVFLERTRGLRRNIEWRNLMRGRRLAPHGEVYRAIMLAIGEEGGLDRLRSQPFPTLVTASRFPDVLGPGQAAVVGIAAYQLEKALRSPFLHPRWGRALGFRPVCFDARDCQSPAELADLVLASSATPPFTPVGSFRGQALLDGGLVDNAPAFVTETWPGIDRVIVLLTRPAPKAIVGRRGGRLYLAPSEALPVGRWDYTRPEGVDLAIATGERDADAFVAALDAFLGERRPPPDAADVAGQANSLFSPPPIV
jgi:hypothetical protein